MSGGLAQVFGRKSIMLGALTIFAAGSAICGAAQSMNMLIAGRSMPFFVMPKSVTKNNESHSGYRRRRGRLAYADYPFRLGYPQRKGQVQRPDWNVSGFAALEASYLLRAAPGESRAVLGPSLVEHSPMRDNGGGCSVS